MAKKGEHLSDKNQRASYKNQGRYLANKKKKLERHLKKFPDDLQAQEALKNASETHIRKTPNSYVWKKRQMKYAQQLASLGYNGNAALGGKDEQKLQEEVVGFGAKQVLDIPPNQRSGKPKKK